MKTGDDRRNAKLAAMAVAALLIGATSAGAAQPPAPAQPQGSHRNVVTKLVTAVAPTVATLSAAEMAQQRALLTAELDGLRIERTAHVMLQRAEITRIAKLAEATEAADLEALRDVRFVFDRDLDATDQASFVFDVYADNECAAAQPGNIWSAAADMVVSAARLPARAGIVVRAMLGAFAKVTPRVVRALL